MNVRDALELVLAREVVDLDLGCDVVVGSSEEERPLECVVVAAEDAEHQAGGMYLVEAEIRVLVPAGRAAAAEDSSVRMGKICDFLESGAFRGRDFATGLYVAGCVVLGQGEDRGTRLIENRVSLRVGCGME